MDPTLGQAIKLGTQDFSKVGKYHFTLEAISLTG
jgi:hypothetical protein